MKIKINNLINHLTITKLYNKAKQNICVEPWSNELNILQKTQTAEIVYAEMTQEDIEEVIDTKTNILMCKEPSEFTEIIKKVLMINKKRKHNSKELKPLLICIP